MPAPLAAQLSCFRRAMGLNSPPDFSNTPASGVPRPRQSPAQSLQQLFTPKLSFSSSGRAPRRASRGDRPERASPGHAPTPRRVPGPLRAGRTPASVLPSLHARPPSGSSSSLRGAHPLAFPSGCHRMGRPSKIHPSFPPNSPTKAQNEVQKHARFHKSPLTAQACYGT